MGRSSTGEARSATPAVPQLPHVFCWLLEGSSVMTSSLLLVLLLQLGVYFINSPLQNQRMTIVDHSPSYTSDPCTALIPLQCCPCQVPSSMLKCPEGLLGRVDGKRLEASQTQRLAAALLSLSDLEFCSSPAGPDFLTCERL